jgi:hypothetical protein
LQGISSDLQKQKDCKMTPTSKTFTAAGAALFTSMFFVIASPAAYADDFCITSGAQVAHGCGYPTMEACRAASAGIGGTCAASASNNKPNEALAYQPKQAHRHARKTRVGQ